MNIEKLIERLRTESLHKDKADGRKCPTAGRSGARKVNKTAPEGAA